MQGEKGGGKSRRPDIPGCFMKKQKQQSRRADMQKKTRQMMSSGMIPEEAPVQHMRQQC